MKARINTVVVAVVSTWLVVGTASFAADTKTDSQRDKEARAKQENNNKDQEGLMYGSALIGQPVRNSEGQQIGHIADVMINPKDGKIKYGVLNVGEGFLGIGNKNIAIPWGSYQLGTTQSGYVLNLDKDTLAKTPEVDRRSWEARNVKVEKDGTTYRSTAGTPAENRNVEPVEGEKSYSGTVEAIDPAARTLTVKKLMVKHDFRLTEGLPDTSLNRFKPGDEVQVFYTERDGANIVHRIVPAPEK